MPSNTLHLQRFHQLLVDQIDQTQNLIATNANQIGLKELEIKTARAKIDQAYQRIEELSEESVDLQADLRNCRSQLRDINEDHGPFKPLDEEE